MSHHVEELAMRSLCLTCAFNTIPHELESISHDGDDEASNWTFTYDMFCVEGASKPPGKILS